MTADTLIASRCELGEGPLWWRDRLWFFDITNDTLHACDAQGGAHRTWAFDGNASAAAPTTDGRLIVATERELMLLTPDTDERTSVCPLEADNNVTRSNDGRADRQGGFWIGTMGKTAEAKAGAIYRFYKGELRKLLPSVTIPNAICFAPDGNTAYFTDTDVNVLNRWALDLDGWPMGAPQPVFDASGESFGLDGAVVDATGHIWCALWGAGKVVRISPEGQIVDEIAVPAEKPTCPAFGADLRTLYVTSALQGITDAERATDDHAGNVFVASIQVDGLCEPEVIV